MAEVKTVRAGENVAAANAAGAAAMASAATKYPDAPVSSPDLVQLPGGLRLGPDKAITTAQVKELTGHAEEALARAGLPDPRTGVVNAFHYMATLLEQGVHHIGDADPVDSATLLKRLLIGDRDAILLGVRIFTYGKDLDIQQWECPHCGDLSDIVIDLYTDIAIKTLDNPDENTFEVKLRNGATAAVRLPTGEDQQAMSENPKTTQAERNTITLQRCVSTVTDANGALHSMAGFPSLARDMSIPDRRKILKEIGERQPGPQLNDVKFTHAACGNEVSLSLGIGDLFLA